MIKMTAERKLVALLIVPHSLHQQPHPIPNHRLHYGGE